MNGTYTMGFTPVFYASTYGHAGVVKVLVESKANISLECAKLLVESKAPLESKDKGNRNPLGVAKDKNQTEVAKYLESVGCKP